MDPIIIALLAVGAPSIPINAHNVTSMVAFSCPIMEPRSFSPFAASAS